MKTINTNLNKIEGTALITLNVREPSFEMLIIQTVDEVLTRLGYSCKKQIYQTIAREFNINRDEIPFKTKEFAEALEAILGPGARLIEIEIMRLLHSRVPHSKCSVENPKLSFDRYIASISESV